MMQVMQTMLVTQVIEVMQVMHVMHVLRGAGDSDDACSAGNGFFCLFYTSPPLKRQVGCRREFRMAPVGWDGNRWATASANRRWALRTSLQMPRTLPALTTRTPPSLLKVGRSRFAWKGILVQVSFCCFKHSRGSLKHV